jgi:hypothetical protein
MVKKRPKLLVIGRMKNLTIGIKNSFHENLWSGIISNFQEILITGLGVDIFSNFPKCPPVKSM